MAQILLEFDVDPKRTAEDDSKSLAFVEAFLEVALAMLVHPNPPYRAHEGEVAIAQRHARDMRERGLAASQPERERALSILLAGGMHEMADDENFFGWFHSLLPEWRRIILKEMPGIAAIVMPLAQRGNA